VFNEMRHDAQALHDNARELKRLASERFAGWLGSATWHWGEALALRGQLEEGIAQMREGLAIQQSGHERCYRSGPLLYLAEAQAKAGHPEEGLANLAEALALVEETDERYCEAELYRLKGELLLLQGNDAEAEVSLQHAIEVARQQQARSWELRATTSLCRLWQKQGKQQEARQMLAEIYGWFTEGFGTPDLQEARALLDELT
jgi:predicted ATPase